MWSLSITVDLVRHFGRQASLWISEIIFYLCMFFCLILDGGDTGVMSAIERVRSEERLSM